jgi:hypothetical protein
MKVFKVTRPDCGNQSCIYRDWVEVASEFDGAELGDVIHVELVEMSEKELAELPEFDGW